jgi:enoyl-CoA hydratase
MKTLTCEINNQIALLRVNRPEVLNAVNRTVLEELQIFLEVTAQQQKIKAVILSGVGEKAFIAGADIKEMQTLDHHQMLDFCRLGQHVANLLESAPFLTIAAVNGYALGAGFELAMACDLIYASRSAQFGLPEVKLGLIPGFGGTQRLTSRVGLSIAKELIMSGRKISAEEAKSLHIVNNVCEPPFLIDQCHQVVAEILQNPFNAVMQAKLAINSHTNLTQTAALELERNKCAVSFSTPESKEAITAFLQARQPRHQ